MAGETDNAAASGGGLHPASNSASKPAPAEQQPAREAGERQQPENPRTRGHSPARDHREAQPAVAPDAKIKLGESEYLQKDVLDALAQKAERAVRKALLPADPSGYETKFRDSFVQPVGMDFTFSKEDAAHGYGLKGLKEFALRNELGQDEVSELLELHATTQFEGIAARQAFHDGEAKKLGGNAVPRIEALHRWFNSHLGEEIGGHMMAGLVTEGQVRGFEKIMNLITNQGAAEFTQSGRAQPEKPSSIPAFDGDNFSQVRQAQDASNALLAAARRNAGRRG